MKFKKKRTKSIRNNKTALDLLPTFTEYETQYKKDKERLFTRVLNNTNPDELSKDYMKYNLTTEKNVYKKLLDKDYHYVEDTARKILLLQEAELLFYENLLSDETNLQAYINSKLKKAGVSYEKERT